MTVRRLLPLLLALALGVSCALLVACGDEADDEKLLSSSRAETIREELDTIEERVQKGECNDLGPAFIRLDRAVDGLPAETDLQLRRRLADGVDNLERIAPEECRDNRPKTTETTETIPPETVETVPPETVETIPPETVETVPPETTTQTTPEEPVPPEEDEQPVLPEDTGGDQAPGAGARFVPPGQVKKGAKR